MGSCWSITSSSACASSRGSPWAVLSCRRCPHCHGLRITREGRRYKKLETIQLWRCHDCDRVFTPQIATGKTFPLAVILDALMRYYHGDTRERVAVHIKERFFFA